MVAAVPVTIRRLAREDDTQDFRAPAVFQRFLREFARQNQDRHHVGTTYVAVLDDRRVVGYATVAITSVEFSVLPHAVRKRLPGYPLPALRLGQLAVDERHEGQGIGGALLRHVLLLAIELSEKAGCIGVIVDSVPDKVDWYARRSFMPLQATIGESALKPTTTAMFLPLAAIRALAPAS